MSMTQPIQIIQGGQYGSEAKGAVAAYLAYKERVDIAVRTGATNAGHTCWQGGLRFVMQQLPVGWVNPDTRLVIGAGALVDLDILHGEINTVLNATGEDLIPRLTVDYRAYIHRPTAAERSRESGRHERIGATGKGSSEALISRLRLRGLENHQIGRNLAEIDPRIAVEDTESLLNRSWDAGASIQLEGTQGQLLDLCLGPYPYTTHKQTGPGQWLLEAGLSPALPTDIVMVLRTFPIRVAGNSGPLPDEISWVDLAEHVNSIRRGAGLPPIVSLESLEAYQTALAETGKSFNLRGYEAHQLHRITSPADRVLLQEPLSNLASMAFRSLPQTIQDDLSGLFEMTTVTKKLRRIARFNYKEVAHAARQIRPHRVVVNFMNYLYPERWYTEDPLTADEVSFLRRVEEVCKAPVVLVNRGPQPQHFISAVRKGG